MWPPNSFRKLYAPMTVAFAVHLASRSPTHRQGNGARSLFFVRCRLSIKQSHADHRQGVLSFRFGPNERANGATEVVSRQRPQQSQSYDQQPHNLNYRRQTPLQLAPAKSHSVLKAVPAIPPHYRRCAHVRLRNERIAEKTRSMEGTFVSVAVSI